MSLEKRMKSGLFRFGVIAPLVCRRLEAAERQELRCQISRQLHNWPDGLVKRVGARTLSRWLSRYRSHGFDGLLDVEKPSGSCRGIDTTVLLRAEELRKELPSRSVRSIMELLKSEGLDTGKLAASTLARQLKSRGVKKERLTDLPGNYQRWEQAKANDLWQADTAHGIWLPDPYNPKKAKKCKLIAFIDDASRVFTHAQFYWDEQLPSLIDCFRKSLLKRGKPRRLLLDNAFIFHATTLKELCAHLGIEISFCQPYAPSSKGKIERGLGSIKSRFYPEASSAGITTLPELNEFLFAWLTKEYHHQIHGGLKGLTPIERWRQDEHNLLRVTADDVRKAVMLRATRKVHLRTATVSVASVTYQLSAALAGESVEVRWQGDRNHEAEIWLNGKCVEIAKPLVVAANIDFSRKLVKPEVTRGPKVLASAKRYRRQIEAGKLGTSFNTTSDLVCLEEFTSIVCKILERELSAEEKDLLCKFFLDVSPISESTVVNALNLATRAKGKNLHLRFYCHHLSESLKQQRS